MHETSMNEQLEKVREEIGTKPRTQQLPQGGKHGQKSSTKFYRGVNGIEVDLIDAPLNPYKALVTMVTATWGGVWDTYRWARLSPKSRLTVVAAVLARNTLPNAMESFSFTFEVAGASRSAFDQIARARIGAVFSSMGWRDNSHENIGFRVPEHIWSDPKKLTLFKAGRLQDKEDYVDMLKDRGSWQDARSVLPISALHRFACSFSYMALQNFMSKRLMFNEQADTVAVAWQMRECLKEVHPLLASYLRPASDWAGKCLEHGGDKFGNLFRCSGRWPCDQSGDKFTFNYSCTSPEQIAGQCGVFVPKGDEEMPSQDITLDDLDPRDRRRFMEM